MKSKIFLLALLLGAGCLLLASPAAAQIHPCPFGGCTLGTAANDVLTGGAGADCICGLQGNDVISGRGGPDDLYGNEGTDCLYGQGDNDDLYGGPARDFLYGGANRDNLYGGDGGDCLYGQADIDFLDGGVGTDACFTGEIHVSCEAINPTFTNCVKIQPNPGGTYQGPGDVVPGS